MNQQTYRKITDGIRGLKNGEKIVQFINSIATKIVYMAYVVGIIILFDEKNKGLARFVAVTAISFILVALSEDLLTVSAHILCMILSLL